MKRNLAVLRERDSVLLVKRVRGGTSRIGGDTLSHYDGITQTAKRLPLWFVFREWSGSAQVWFHTTQ